MLDVTVLGAGAFGLSVAWCCAKRGAKVRVIDPQGVGAGASGGLVGALAPHTPENWNAKKAFQFESLIMAEDWWAEAEEAGGVTSGYGRTGRLQPIRDEHALDFAHARTISAKQLWQGKARWQVVGQNTLGAWAPKSPTGFLIFDTLSARMFPRRACASLAAGILAKGGEIVKSGAHDGKVVWATGWLGLIDISKEMGVPFGNGVKGQAALLRLDQSTSPQIYADALHIVPHADGTVAIGSTSERDFDNPETPDEQLDAVLERAYVALPALRDAEVIERWAGVRPRAKSRAPMMGPHPTRRGEFIANGGFKIGFGMGPKVGEVMADLLLDGVDAIPDDFRPQASL
ncbi:FAD-dependent oxidoreductase [Shimia sp. NS0008-38b]|uniref:NAD(P)/FAD-dependent oxidoreductase n=1 Tax=Shimia sp. NS0008-38b TaxID=3127653 RepID=UPI00333F1D10